MEQIQTIIDLIDASIKEDAGMNITEGEIIADGYDATIDEYRKTVAQENDWLVNYQAELSQRTGISNIKIKYTNNSGYFIELPKSQQSKVSDSFVHKQTLVNAVRYVTIELKKFEEKVLEAQNKKAEKEYEVFQTIREQILDSFQPLKQASEMVANIDFLSNL